MFNESYKSRGQDLPAMGETELDEPGALNEYDFGGDNTEPTGTYQDDLDYRDDSIDPLLLEESEPVKYVAREEEEDAPSAS